MMAIALMVSSLLCACATGRTTSFNESGATSPAATPRTGLTLAMADVQRFYKTYVAAGNQGTGAVEALVRTQVASWYLPIFEAPSSEGGGRAICGLRRVVTDWSFTQVGVLGGQTVIVIGSRPQGEPQQLWIVVTAEPGTGKITGITCSIGGTNVTSAGAKDAATALFSYYIAARRRGASPQHVIARLLEGGPTSGSWYLQQVQYARARHRLSYDPVTCAAAGVPTVSVGAVKIVAGGSVGLVVVSTHGTRALATVVLGAKGWTLGDIACPQQR